MKLGEEQMGLENLARLRKQDIVLLFWNNTQRAVKIFLRRRVRDFTRWFRFLTLRRQFLPCWSWWHLRFSKSNSRFNLQTGDKIEGKIRPPKEGERYFALLKVDQVNDDKPEVSRSKILFENLTPLHANSRLRMERGNGSTEDLTRVFGFMPLSDW